MDIPNVASADGPADSRMQEAPVLIVEDDLIIRTALRSALKGVGIEVAEAADGQAAGDYVSRRRSSLILLDMGLPILDGVTVGLTARSLSESLPIIVLSADSHVVEKARHVGAIAYLPKPFDLDALLDTVQYALQVSGRHADPR